MLRRCCPILGTEFEHADCRTYSIRRSSWIEHFILLSRDIYDRWRPGVDNLCTGIGFAAFDVWLSWAHDSETISGRFRPDRVDSTKIWRNNGPISESSNVESDHSKTRRGMLTPLLQTHYLISLYGCRALCPAADYSSFDGTQRTFCCHY